MKTTHTILDSAYIRELKCQKRWGGGGGGGRGGSAVAQSVECVSLVRRSWVRSPLWQPTPYWLSRYQYNVTGWDRSHGLPAFSGVWQHVKFSDVSLGTRPRYSLVVYEDAKKLTKQTS